MDVGGDRFEAPWSDDGAYALQRLWLDIAAAGRRYSHVVAYGGHLPVAGGPAFARWLDAPLITLFRGNDLDAGMFSPRRAHLVERAIDHAAAVVTVSSDALEKCAKLYGCADKTRFIANGIELSDWAPLPSELAHSQALREELTAPFDGADDDEPAPVVLGLIGQLKAKKGATMLLQAVIDAGWERRFSFLVVGHADEATEACLQEAAETLRVVRRPFLDRSELLSVYPALDVVALPSFFDGMPNVMLEAQALGIPVLAAAVGGIPDVVHDGEQGYLFTPGQAAALREALARVLDDDEPQRRALGAAGRDRVTAAFTAAREAHAYAQLLDEVEQDASRQKGDER